MIPALLLLSTMLGASVAELDARAGAPAEPPPHAVPPVAELPWESCVGSVPPGRLVVEAIDGARATVVDEAGRASCVRAFAITGAARREGAVLRDGRPAPAEERAARRRIEALRAKLAARGGERSPW